MVKVKTKVKLLSTELGKGRRGELKVKAELFSDVESCDM
jgi:hypothetical protein